MSQKKAEPAKAEGAKAPEEKAAEKKAPIVEAGEYYKKVKVRFLGLICGDFGTFDKGDCGEITLNLARELEKVEKVQIIKE